MHRFYLPPGQCQGESLWLDGREAHHAIDVLRIQREETVLVLDGAGTECRCEVSQCSRRQVELRVLERHFLPPLPYDITLLQAVPKGKILESIIQKATELGATRIVPLLSDRVAVRLDDESATQKQLKWQLVAIEAIKQCGSAWLPRVEKPTAPSEFLLRGEAFDLPMIASLQPGSLHAREYFDQYLQNHGKAPHRVCIWVGPEGDFTPDEVSMVIAAGARPITLGRLVLRSETAATFCLSILNYELQSNLAS